MVLAPSMATARATIKILRAKTKRGRMEQEETKRYNPRDNYRMITPTISSALTPF